MPDFGRDICNDLLGAEQREWLVTNGIGGYAMGTVAGLLTRCYHGLLIAALDPPLGRTLLAAKMDETAVYGDRAYPLFANRWQGGAVSPAGYLHLERFHLEGTTPVWTFACADALLEKRVWMQPGANTTYIRYDLARATMPLALDVKALVNYRDHHGHTFAGDWQMQISPVAHGLCVRAFDGAVPFYLLSDRAESTLRHEWYQAYFLSAENYRGLHALDDHLHAGLFRATLRSGESLTLVCSIQAAPSLDGTIVYAERRAYERQLLAKAGPGTVIDAEIPRAIQAGVEHLVLAADQFIV